MKSIEYSFILKAKSEVAQARGTEGNASVLNRIPVELDDGDVAEVPCVSGTAMRHGLREAIALVILDAAGLLGQHFDKPDAPRLLFGGGGNTGSGNTIKLEEMRKMESLVPSMRLFGGTTKNGIQWGRIEVSPMILICEERMKDLEPWQIEALGDREIKPAEAYVDVVTNYARDASDSRTGQAILTDAARTDVLNRKLAREKAGEDDDDVAAEKSKGGQRPYSSQFVKRGSLFTWSVVGHVENDLDESTLEASLAAFLRNPIVGKSSGVGWGRLAVFAARNFDHFRPAEALRVIEPAELVAPNRGAGLLEHIAKRQEEVKACLLNLS